MKLSIHLKNTSTDVEQLEKALRHFDSSIVIENDHIVIVSSSIISDSLDLSISDNIWEAWCKIIEFVDIINGASLIEGFSLKTISISHIRYEDQHGKQQSLGNAGRGEAILPALRSSPPDISLIIPLAVKDKYVAKVLRLSSRIMDWVNLCRVLEVINEDSNNMFVKGKFEFLTRSANNSSATGDQSRHGKIKNHNPLDKTMSLPQAQYLINSTTRKWLNSKLKP